MDQYKKIDAAVEELREDLVQFLSSLVQIPTENPPGNNYPECARFIGETMEAAGFGVEYVRVPDSRLAELAPHGEGLPRVSVIGTMPGKAARPVLHFTGHYDVVPAGDGWTADPYSGEVKDGKIFGRGSSDQKSGIAAQIFAVKALQKAGIELQGTVISSATPDEETGGFGGVGYLVEQGIISKKNTDYCVITECLDADKICLGHRGTLWLEVETFGKQSHGSMPGEGINAVEKMLDLLQAVRGTVVPDLCGESGYPVMPPACRKSTLTVTMINAGSKINIVPAKCRATIDWRLIPEQSVSGAKAKLEQVFRRLHQEDPDFRAEVRELMAVEPTLVPDNTEVVKAFQKASEGVLGKQAGFSLSPGSDDQKFIVQQAGLEQCIVYGPGPLAIAHQADEYQPVEDLVKGCKIMARAACDLLGRAP